MDQDLNVFLSNAKLALDDYFKTSAEVNELRVEKEKLEANLNTLKSKRDEQIAQTYKKRRSEIDKTYDGEIDKCNDKLRKSQVKREKAKNQGMKERIAEETAELKKEAKNLSQEVRAILKENHVSSICDNSFFYSLYLPNSFGDVLTILLTFAVVFFLIPFGIYKFLFDGNTTALIIIYILDVLIFGGIYVLVSRATIMKHHNALLEARHKKDQITHIKRRIGDITHNILNDKSESQYDLAIYDDEIAHIRQELADVTMKKNEALNTFETVTKNIINDEISSSAKPKIDEAQMALDNSSLAFTNLEAERKEKALALSSNYEVYLGKEFMNKAKIDKLIEIVNHSTCTNISEVIEEYKRANDI